MPTAASLKTWRFLFALCLESEWQKILTCRVRLSNLFRLVKRCALAKIGSSILARVQPMTPEKISKIQQALGLSDNKMAQALGVTRQTFRNWRNGCKCPPLAQNAIRWMLELRRVDPQNDNLPTRIRFTDISPGDSIM
jgi:DNA-binding transcriptional regulator YiaG